MPVNEILDFEVFDKIGEAAGSMRREGEAWQEFCVAHISRSVEKGIRIPQDLAFMGAMQAAINSHRKSQRRPLYCEMALESIRPPCYAED